MELEDVLPFVPDEEAIVHENLQKIFKHLVTLKKSSTFTVGIVDKVKDEFELNMRELLQIRHEFKRLKSNSTTSSNAAVDPSTAMLSKSPVESVVELALVLTPTDMLAQQIAEFISQMTDGLLKKISPLLYPVFARLNDIHRKLDRLRETGAFSVEDDLLPRQRELAAIENAHLHSGIWVASSPSTTTTPMVASPGSPVPAEVPEGQAIMSSKLNTCYRLVHQMISEIENLDESMLTVYNRLLELWKRLYQLQSKGNPVSYAVADVNQIQTELRSIDSMRHGYLDKGKGPGTFIAADASIPSGQAMVIGLLESCFELTHSLLSMKDPVSGPLRPIYEQLIELRRDLYLIFEGRHFWTIDGDLQQQYDKVLEIQQQLKKIESRRKDGKFVAAVSAQGSNQATVGVREGQAVLHFLLHKCYRLVYKNLMHIQLLSSSTPATSPTDHQQERQSHDGVAGTLMKSEMIPIHKGLMTVRLCLCELKKHAPWTDKDLRPWKMKLVKHDADLRSVGESVILNSLWNECFDLLMEMEAQLNEPESEMNSRLNNSDEDDNETGRDTNDNNYNNNDRFKSYRHMPVAKFGS